ncbi:MAG: response regulator [Candidatus Magnetomorum sp.]|nr:response regulator [Candidatus Magnetomorum sp.]
MSKKILVVDDDPTIVDYLTTLFEDNGYTVLSASDAQQGLEIAKAEPPDLITLDLEMPGDWGPRFYRRMTQVDALTNVPVIVISGLTSNQYAIPKAVATISKPFDKDKLLKIIKDTLKG